MQVLITVLVNGGGTHYLLERWELQQSAARMERSQELAPMLADGNTSHPVQTGESSLPGSPSSFGGSRCVTCCCRRLFKKGFCSAFNCLCRSMLACTRCLL